MDVDILDAKTWGPVCMTPPPAEGVARMEQQQRVMTVEKQLSKRQEPPEPSGGRDGRAIHGAMLMRSTGLGKAELVAEIVGIRRQGDYLIMELHTTQPVRWKIRGGMSHKDLRMLIRAMMKTSVLSFLLNVRAWFKEPAHPGDF